MFIYLDVVDFLFFVASISLFEIICFFINCIDLKFWWNFYQNIWPIYDPYFTQIWPIPPHFAFNLNLPFFEGKITKMITRLNSRIFFKFTNFPKNGCFHEKFQKSYIGWNSPGEFVKIREFMLVIIIVIFHQKWQFRLKIDVLEFLGIQPYHKSLPSLTSYDPSLTQKRLVRGQTLPEQFYPIL